MREAGAGGGTLTGERRGGYNGSMADDKRINFKYKDTVFRLLFSDKDRLLSLYNALSPKHCDSVDDLTVVTLEDAIYMEVKNDIAFLVGTDIHLYEHQSTINPNMSLRFLQYIAAEYQRLTNKRSIYSRKIVKLPTPHFVVFYNGTEISPDHSVLKLSDAFEGQGSADAQNGENKQPALELLVDVYNINAGCNSALQEACETLKGYAEFVRRTRDNQKVMPFARAINKAVDDCIHDGILADFLKDSKAEVVGVSIFEFDREEYDDMVREEGAYDTKIATARNFLAMGVLSVEQIAQGTGLTPEEVAAL